MAYEPTEAVVACELKEDVKAYELKEDVKAYGNNKLFIPVPVTDPDIDKDVHVVEPKVGEPGDIFKFPVDTCKSPVFNVILPEA